MRNFLATTFEDRIADWQANFRNATPFPHVVIDGLFDEELLRQVIVATREIEHNTTYADQTTQGKKTCDDWRRFPQPLFEIISYMNCGDFISLLCDITEIGNLVGDPHLVGGGYHETTEGGFLKMHTDFNYSERIGMDRRINAILFLNENWIPDWGGELVLADPSMKSMQKIAPLFNRLVVFATDDYSFHGQPDPHHFPAGDSRKSLALYYYSNGRPLHEVSYRKSGTTYKARFAGDVPLTVRLKEALRLLVGTKRVRGD